MAARHRLYFKALIRQPRMNDIHGCIDAVGSGWTETVGVNKKNTDSIGYVIVGLFFEVIFLIWGYSVRFYR